MTMLITAPGWFSGLASKPRSAHSVDVHTATPTHHAALLHGLRSSTQRAAVHGSDDANSAQPSLYERQTRRAYPQQQRSVVASPSPC